MTDVREQKTDSRRQRKDDKVLEFRSGNKLNSEAGPVVVPNGWDYAAASMRKVEKKEGGKVRR